MTVGLMLANHTKMFQTQLFRFLWGDQGELVDPKKLEIKVQV